MVAPEGREILRAAYWRICPSVLPLAYFRNRRSKFCHESFCTCNRDSITTARSVNTSGFVGSVIFHKLEPLRESHRDCLDMYDTAYARSDSPGGSTGSVWPGMKSAILACLVSKLWTNYNARCGSNSITSISCGFVRLLRICCRRSIVVQQVVQQIHNKSRAVGGVAGSASFVVWTKLTHVGPG